MLGVGLALLWVPKAPPGVSSFYLALYGVTLGKVPVTVGKDLLTTGKGLLTAGKTVTRIHF